LRWPNSPIESLVPRPDFPALPEQIRVKGESFIKELGKRFNNNGRLPVSVTQNALLKDNTMGLLWKVLRNLDWAEVH